MQEFIQTYLNKLDLTAIIENILTKVLSLLFLFLLASLIAIPKMTAQDRIPM